MGEVYRAEDLKLGVPVAMKLLPQADPLARVLPGHAEAIQRLHREVRLGREVAHPNVCRIFDIAELEGEHALVMEYVDGEDLASLLRRIGRLHYDHALRVARALCSGLAAAHEKGVLHRDLKPANVLIDGRGHPRITDFGLALRSTDSGRQPEIAGTPAYMSPEQLAGCAASARSDLYALGLVIYEVLTGRRLFESGSLAELRAEHESRPPLSLKARVPEIDARVQDALCRCLEERPEDRPASAREVLAALPGGDPLQEALEAGETPSPDMVAAASETGVLHPGIAWVCLLTTLALASVRLMSGGIPYSKPPEGLVERAREVLVTAGDQPAPRDSAWGFFTDWRYGNWHWQTWLSQRGSGTIRADAAVFRPGPDQFFYRESPRLLAATGSLDATPWVLGPRPTSAVDRRDPPMDVSGMTEVVLDHEGRLVRFLAVPPQKEGPPADEPSVDWRPFFEKAGLEQTEFASAVPLWAAEVDTDRHEAWEGTPAHLPDVPLRVEAASYHGRPVWFEVQVPWLQATRTGPLMAWTLPTLRVALGSYLLVALVVAVGSGVLARRNLLLGRGDRRGAARIGIYAMGSLALAEMLRTNHVSSAFLEYHILERVLMLSLAWALWAAIAYIALEPLVRRRWPRTLTSWHRLLSGRLRDPMVGRDVLIGATAGTAILWSGWGGPLPVWESRLEILSDARRLASFLLLTPYRSVAMALATLLLLLLLSTLLRSRWIALPLVGVAFLLPMVGVSDDLWRDVPRAAVAAAVIVAGTVRFGLLAASTGFLMSTAVAVLPPLSVGVTDWYAGRTLVGALFLGALVVASFWVSLGGRSALGVRPLDG